MKIGFDLDGTLDRPAVAALCKALIAAGHEVHIISGCFDEAGQWQDVIAKQKKLYRLGIYPLVCHVIHAVDHKQFDRDYRLVDLGLRKGAYISEQGIEIMFDDSELYCKTMPSMCGAQIVRVL